MKQDLQLHPSELLTYLLVLLILSSTELAPPSLMALAKERSQRGFAPARGGLPVEGFDASSLGFLGFKGHHDTILEDEGCSDPLVSFGMMGHLPTLSDLSNSSSSNGVAYGAASSSLREASPIVDFKSGAGHWAYSSSSVLSFEQGDRLSHGSYPTKVGHEEKFASWIDHEYQLNHLGSKGSANSRLIQDVSCFEMASGYGLSSSMIKDGQHGEEQLELLYSDVTAVDSIQEDEGHDTGSQKRTYSGDDVQAHKKHCGNGKKAKAMAKLSASKDPQSIAAKNRRERISERLKVLQELVPNGTKVDLVTMLEKAISYVKFLQLQVKVLATDEFWPTQGGKAPEVAQVKEAIDAILASHRDRSSS